MAVSWSCGSTEATGRKLIKILVAPLVFGGVMPGIVGATEELLAEMVEMHSRFRAYGGDLSRVYEANRTT